MKTREARATEVALKEWISVSVCFSKSTWSDRQERITYVSLGRATRLGDIAQFPRYTPDTFYL